MTKRFQPFKEFGRTMKKPKLDISINHKTGTGGLNFMSRGPWKSSQASNNFWCDDDDDDVILLATQVAETQAAVAQVNGQCVDNITDSEITFSEFIPNVHASTSTQVLPPTSATTAAPMPKRNMPSELFDDDDDEFALMAALVDDNIEPHKSTKVKELDVFKKPAGIILPRNSKEIHVNHEKFAFSQEPSDNIGTQVCRLSDQTTARRELAAERQIKFLMDRINKLKNEKTELTKDLNDTKSQMESKNGEVALLRDELKHKKQQIQTLKMEKIYCTEAARAESKTKIAELSKVVEAKQSELQLKSVECSVLKMRHADETKRLEMSTRDISMCPATTDTETNHEVDEHSDRREIDVFSQALNRLSSLKLNASITNVMENITTPTQLKNEFLFKLSEERGIGNMQRTLFQVELEHIQMIVAQLQQERSVEHTHSCCERIIASVGKVFSEFWSYVHSLEFPKSYNSHSYHGYELEKDLSESTHICLLQPCALFEEERALNLRRYVTILSVVCRLLPPLTAMLLTLQHEKYVLLEIAIDAIMKLSYTKEVCDHFGLLEAFAVLLHIMLLNISAKNVVTTDQQLKLLMTLLKQLVFVRPNAWIFRELSRCLLQCTQVPKTLSFLCVNSEEHCFVYDHNKLVYCFSNDSCILQVYAGMLDISFPVNNPLHAKHFELLTVICDNHVRFVYECFTQPPEFIFHLLPSYNEEDEEDVNNPENSNQLLSHPTTTTELSTSQNSINSDTAVEAKPVTLLPTDLNKNCSCKCYTKLCLSVVTLLFQLLHQWVISKKTWDTSRVSDISKISVQLLHIIFCDNYLTCLFRDDEDTTKHYLCLICKWWTENVELLEFEELHLNFLEKLNNSHVISQLKTEESSSAVISSDLEEWCRLTNESVSYSNEDIKSADMDKLLLESEEQKFFEGLEGYAFNFQ